MCGIFGVISKNKIDSLNLEKVSKSIKHRGPDDEGYLLFDLNRRISTEYSGNDTIKDIHIPHIRRNDDEYNSAFVHRRLSIIDLSMFGHQPMSYDNENYWITYNGEIYNYIELKEILIEKGHRFKTKTDTEVIMAAYHEWGEDCVSKFNGMWAFAIWDKRNEKVFLSRDRFGIKPLFYFQNAEVFIFSSEIKGIREYVNKNLHFNEDSIIRFIYDGQFNVGISNETMFQNVYHLSPGHNLIFDTKSISIKRYWVLNVKTNNLSLEENIEIFGKIFKDSIRLHLRSDVEVGSCLSGGIDSSSIVSLTSKEFNKRLHTFSAIWPGDDCDESRFVNEVNNLYNCYDHSFEPAIDNIDNVIDKINWHQETPVGGSSLFAQWSVMEMAKKNNIKVLLDGQGADEIIAGYPRFVRTYLNELLEKFQFKEIIQNYSSLKEKGFNIRKILNVRIPLAFYINHNKKLFNSNIRSKLENKHKDIIYSYNNLTEHLVDEINKICLPTLLQYEDRNSMAHSVESRVPFLDYRLVEFSLSIPTVYKIKGSLTKYILRESMKEYLPTKIYNRKDKIGFSTPLEKRLASFDVINKTRNSVKNNKILSEFVDFKGIDNNNYFRINALEKFIKIWQ
jgi:asparagine synthase (glutamine-hydrolysing)